MPPHLHLDFESFSEAELSDVGMYRYAQDPSTELLVAGMSLGDEEPVAWWRGMPDDELDKLDPYWDALENPEVQIWAHNAQAEYAMSKYLMQKTWGIAPPALSRFRCTMSLARRAALPAKLEKLSAFLADSQQTVNVGRATSGGVFKGLFGNTVKEKTVSPQYREHFLSLKEPYAEEIEWLRQRMKAGYVLSCPGCPQGSPTCHARIIEQELGVAPQSFVKDATGKRLIKKFSMMQPAKKPTKKNPAGVPVRRILPTDDPEDFARFVEYCRQDVRAEQSVARRLAYFGDALNNANYTLHEVINARGVPVNIAALRHAQKLIDEETEIVGAKFKVLTGFEVTQQAKVLAWAQSNGYPAGDLQQATVESFLEGENL